MSAAPPNAPAGAESVAGYSFRVADLDVGGRRPGVSAFMRIRNGEAFLEAAIRSHADAFDEIVAVYNQCTDATPDILARLARELGPKLRVFHYLDRVHPPGSSGHAAEPAHSPHSLVNYYNFALSRTRFSHATKLDDDHVAIPSGLAALAAGVRGGAFGAEMSCFSGINLARDAAGRVEAPRSEPFAGTGDHGIFPVTPDTYFVHDRRFERFRRGAMPRRFRGFVYWHLKYLKPDLGFGNYELADNPAGRYARKRAALGVQETVPVEAIEVLARVPDHLIAAARRLGLPLPEKLALKADRWIAFAQGRKELGAALRELPASVIGS